MRVLSWINFENYLMGVMSKDDCIRASFNITKEVFERREWIGTSKEILPPAAAGNLYWPSAYTIIGDEMCANDIPSSKKYRDNFDRIFNK